MAASHQLALFCAATVLVCAAPETAGNRLREPHLTATLQRRARYSQSCHGLRPLAVGNYSDINMIGGGVGSQYRAESTIVCPSSVRTPARQQPGQVTLELAASLRRSRVYRTGHMLQ